MLTITCHFYQDNALLYNMLYCIVKNLYESKCKNIDTEKFPYFLVFRLRLMQVCFARKSFMSYRLKISF